MIKVMVVEDQHLVRSCIVRLLSEVEGIQVIAEADNGEDAIKIAQEKSPHVVLMDLKLPRMGGLEATREILSINPTLKIIILTAYCEDPLPKILLQAGASGYLSKGASLEEMVKAIRTAQSGRLYLSPLIAQALAINSVEGSNKSNFEALSDREQQVMKMITAGINTQEIASKFNISAKTVNTYRYRLYEKLKIESDVELTLLAIRHGLLKTEN